MLHVWIFVLFLAGVLTTATAGHGFMLLYRPFDVTKDCRESTVIKYYISYGMGMSDTISLAFKTKEIPDYQCVVEIHCDPDVPIIFVVQYPNSMAENCARNPEGISSIKNDMSLKPLCMHVNQQWRESKYFKTVAWAGYLKFHFKSINNINEDMNVDYYLVTATAAHLIEKERPVKLNTKRRRQRSGGTYCRKRNETLCVIEEKQLCFTNGVVCDGIKNCGVSDWYDERSSICQAPPAVLGAAAALTVLVSISCALIAIGHAVCRCIPPLATSFFIFNANEDNRLYITSAKLAPTPATIIPSIPMSDTAPSTSNSSTDDVAAGDVINLELVRLSMTAPHLADVFANRVTDTAATSQSTAPRLSVFNVMKEKITNTIRKLSHRAHIDEEAPPSTLHQTSTMHSVLPDPLIL